MAAGEPAGMHKKPLLKRANAKSKTKYVRITDGSFGITFKDGFKFGLGFWLASAVVTIALGLLSMSIMGILGTVLMSIQGIGV